MINKQTVQENNINEKCNFGLTIDRFVSQDEIDKAMAVATSLDFTQMNKKLVDVYKWSESDVEVLHDTYMKWLALQACYPDVAFAPNVKLDEYWHTHILDTQKYMEDCQFVFGRYLHHYPYFGLEGDADDLDTGFNITKKLFKHHFDQELTGVANPCSSSSCR